MHPRLAKLVICVAVMAAIAAPRAALCHRFILSAEASFFVADQQVLPNCRAERDSHSNFDFARSAAFAVAVSHHDPRILAENRCNFGERPAASLAVATPQAKRTRLQI